MQERILGVVDLLSQIEQDFSVPKNARAKIKNTILVLNEETDIPVKVNKAIDELTYVADDSNIPVYTRTQILNIMSILESKE